MCETLFMQWIDKHRRIAVVAVLLLGALLRFQDINRPYVDSFAWREADTASIADTFASGNWNIFLPQVRWGGPGPNYIGAEFQIVSYIAAFGYQAFGAAPWVGRVVSVAFGLWGIFALYQLVCRVWDTRQGIATAAVMAMLPGSVFVERSFLPDGAIGAGVRMRGV
jgi:4-amino-4-deoxy-L-arabinose transferase-like glycosyltransferase